MKVLQLDVLPKITMKSTIPGGIIPTGPEDGPEEGEIVSDDLEDISDDSISFPPCNGKSLSRSDHLNALSLSSITDVEDVPVEKPRKRKKCCSQRHAKRRKRNRRKLIHSDSSDDDTTLDRRLKLQLKAAVHVDVDESHKNNSLRTRLRAMVHHTSGPESENGTTEQKAPGEISVNNTTGSSDVVYLPVKNISVIEIDSGTDSVVSVPDPEVIPTTSEIVVSVTDTLLSVTEHLESSSDQSKDEIDSELIQLRIEALKTAINNKFANRKRRKKDNTNSTLSDDTNKENTNNNNGEIQDKKTENKDDSPQITPQSSNEPDTPPSPEEDEDVLRALLLASMSRKITSIEPEVVKSASTVHARIAHVSTANKKTINNYKLSNIRKNVVNKASGNTRLIKVPQVKPLIISVNSDSDSDLDLSSSPEKSPKKLQKSAEKDFTVKPVDDVAQNLKTTAIESSVDKFLKDQRAKVESEIKKINKASAAEVSNVIAPNKGVKTQGTVAKNDITLCSSIIPKNTVCTKSPSSNSNKVTLTTNKTTTITNKNPQKLNSTPVNSKNVKLTELEKSALKFLPENKREEYKQLQNLLQLRKAQLKRPRVRRVSQKGININSPKSLTIKNALFIKNSLQIKDKPACTEKADMPKVILPNKSTQAAPVVQVGTTGTTISKVKPNNSKVISRPVNYGTNQQIDNASQLSKIEARNQERRNQQLKMDTRNQERKSDALLLHTTLKQMQARKDGRLQIQERYKSLRPLIKKINDVSKEQKHWDQEVKKLLEQLAEARQKQQDVQHNMSAFVKELAEKKQKMDESPVKASSKPKVSYLITSTPLKINIAEPCLDISAVDSAESSKLSSSSVNDQNMLNVNTESTLRPKNKCDSANTAKISKDNAKSRQVLDNTWDQSTKVDNIGAVETSVKRVVSDLELNVVDPNDIDNIIKETVERVAVLEKKSFECRRSEKLRYVSPLDSVKRKEQIDPFAIMCPFEVNGTCKDAECSFKHLPK